MPLLLLLALPVLSGLLAVCSLPSFDFGVLAWIGLAPLLFGLRQRGPLAGTGLGLLFGCVFGIGTFYWLYVVPDATPFKIFLLMIVFGLYYAAFGALYALGSRSLGAWIVLAGPLLWVALEYARASLGFLALPWNFLSHSQHGNLAVIQIADVTGAYGVSFVLVMANQVASQLPDLLGGRRWPWRAHGLALGLVLIAVLLYGWHRLATPPEGREHLRVALVQANLSARSRMSVKEQMTHLGAYDRLTAQAAAAKPDLIVWPSSSLPGPLGFWMIRLYVNDIARRAGAPLLVGGAGGDKLAEAREGQLPYSNSEFLISPSGRLEAQYNKIHLTPFTEYVPLQGLVRWPRWLTTLDKSFVRGNDYTLLRTSAGRFGAPICWENDFPDLFRRFVFAGANFMVSVTNEGLFGATSAPHQTLAINVFRAVENRVAIARAATTGVSAFIDSRGRIVARVEDGQGRDVFVPGVIVWDVPLSESRTFYTRHGDVFAQTATGAALVSLLVSARRARQAPAT